VIELDRITRDKLSTLEILANGRLELEIRLEKELNVVGIFQNKLLDLNTG
jgi:hypothetical protein